MGNTSKNQSEDLPRSIKSDTRVLLAWHRSHLANERTFLAWSRTGIALLALGFLIEKFDIFIRSMTIANMKESDPGPALEVLCLSVGSFIAASFIILLAGFRFIQVKKHIDLGEPTFSVMPEFLVGLAFLAIVVMSIVLISIKISTIWALF